MNENLNPDDLKSQVARDKRNSSLMMLLAFGMLSLYPSYKIWQLQRPISLTSDVSIARPALLETTTIFRSKVMHPELFNQEIRRPEEESFALTLMEGIKASHAEKLGAQVSDQDRGRKIQDFEWFWEDYAQHVANLPQAQKLRLYKKFEVPIDQLCLAQKLESLFIDTLLLLPYERAMRLGEARFEVVDVGGMDEAEVDVEEPTVAEVENFYAKNLEQDYRQHASCKVRFANITEQDLENQPRPQPTTLKEAKEYLRKHPELWSRPAKRCFRYLEMSTLPGLNHSTLSKESFQGEKVKLDVKSLEELPPEFGERLFSMKPGEVASGLYHEGSAYAIQYLFERPAISLSLKEVLPLGYLKAYQEKVESKKKDAVEQLNWLPKHPPQLQEKHWSELMSKLQWKLKWKTLGEHQPIHALLNGVMEYNQFDKGCAIELKKMVEKKLNTQDSEADSSDKTYYFINGPGTLILEITELKAGKLSPLSEAKSKITYRLKAEAQSQKFDQWTFDMAQKLKAQDLEREEKLAGLGEEREVGCDSFEVIESQIQGLRELCQSVAPSAEMVQELHELQLAQWVNALPLPFKNQPLYALIPKKYHRYGQAMLLKYIDKKSLLEPNASQGEVAEEQYLRWQYECEEQLKPLLLLWLLPGQDAEELKSEMEKAHQALIGLFHY